MLMNVKSEDFFSIFVLVALIITAAVLGVLFPEQAAPESDAAQTEKTELTAPPEPDGEYSTDELNIEIQLDAQGNARVSETYTLSFTGGVFSEFARSYPLVDCFRQDWAAYIDDEPLSVIEVPDESRPEGCAAVYENEESAEVELYHRSADQKRRFTIEYTAYDAVTIFNDTAEFCWTLKSEDEENAIPLITATLLFPETQDVLLSAAEYNAWLHTPLGGSVTMEDDYAEFSMSGVEHNAGADIRLALPTRLFPDAGVIENSDAAARIAAEEMRR